MCPLPDHPPIICNSGEFSFSGSVICTSCPAGHSCSPGEAPSQCQIGEYSNVTHCIACPPGFYCPIPTLLPIPCPTGLFSDDHGRSSCKICPIGYQCTDPAQSPKPCSAGTFSTSGSTSCSVSLL